MTGNRMKVGSLIEKSEAGCLLSFIRESVMSEDTENRLDKLNECIQKAFRMSLSEKHMMKSEPGTLAPSPSFKYKMA